jgi:predicted ATP-dependent endonuclease of OLD family
MSKANGAIEKKDTFLQHVSLKNYKSIKDVEIDFKPGLNVIIGKNASGKTNFINGLNSIVRFNYDKLLDSEFSAIFWFQNKKIEINILNRLFNNEELLMNDYYDESIVHNVSLMINNKEVKVGDYDTLKNTLYKNDCFFNSLLVKYGIQYKENTQFVNVPFTFTIVNNRKVSRDLMMVTLDENKTEFIQTFFHRLYIDVVKLYQQENKAEITSEYLKEKISFFSEKRLKNINDIIYVYSPINAIRLNPNFNVISEDSSQKQSIVNFYIEFLINENWLPFNLLSDGTKRLFYIISEILSIYNDDDNLIYNNDLDIILLEEPELGIHPHQLHQLMQFIKEQSKEKQIILTTHSPQVLDALEPDELDRIIICHSDPKNGTQLSHLSDQQIKKAKKYMASEAFLSDYWRFSDLEPA